MALPQTHNTKYGLAPGDRCCFNTCVYISLSCRVIIRVWRIAYALITSTSNNTTGRRETYYLHKSVADGSWWHPWCHSFAHLSSIVLLILSANVRREATYLVNHQATSDSKWIVWKPRSLSNSLLKSESSLPCSYALCWYFSVARRRTQTYNIFWSDRATDQRVVDVDGKPTMSAGRPTTGMSESISVYGILDSNVCAYWWKL